jgi:hypothetical protein
MVARESHSAIPGHDSKSPVVEAGKDPVTSDVDDVEPSVRTHGE